MRCQYRSCNKRFASEGHFAYPLTHPPYGFDYWLMFHRRPMFGWALVMQCRTFTGTGTVQCTGWDLTWRKIYGTEWWCRMQIFPALGGVGQCFPMTNWRFRAEGGGANLYGDGCWPLIWRSSVSADLRGVLRWIEVHYAGVLHLRDHWSDLYLTGLTDLHMVFFFYKFTRTYFFRKTLKKIAN